MQPGIWKTPTLLLPQPNHKVSDDLVTAEGSSLLKFLVFIYLPLFHLRPLNGMDGGAASGLEALKMQMPKKCRPGPPPPPSAQMQGWWRMLKRGAAPPPLTPAHTGRPCLHGWGRSPLPATPHPLRGRKLLPTSTAPGPILELPPQSSCPCGKKLATLVKLWLLQIWFKKKFHFVQFLKFPRCWQFRTKNYINLHSNHISKNKTFRCQ